jgi:hypothetical protein
MAWKHLETNPAGRLPDSTLLVIALRGNAETDEIEVAEVGDMSIAPGAIPKDAVHRIVPARDFQPLPRSTALIAGQIFVLQWAARFGRCSECGSDIEHFAFLGPDRDMVRQPGEESARLTGYCVACAPRLSE